MEEVSGDSAPAASVAVVAPADPDEWRKRPGTPVLTSGGDSGVLVAYHTTAAADGEALPPCDVRFGAARGPNSRTERFLPEALVRPLAAAVGFVVRTPKGRGTVLRAQLATSDGDEDRFEVELMPEITSPASTAAANVTSAKGEEGLEVGYTAPSAEAVLAGAASDGTGSCDGNTVAQSPVAEDTAAAEAVVETFDASEVSCSGAVVLPVVEALTSQADLFLEWGAARATGLVDQWGGTTVDGEEGKGKVDLGFVATLQKGLAASGQALLAQLTGPSEGASDALLLENEPLAAEGTPPEDLQSMDSALEGGGAAVKLRLDATRRATKEVLGEFKDAAAAEARVKQLLGRARARVRELAEQAEPTAKELSAEFGSAVDQSLAAREGGVGLDDVTGAVGQLAGRESRVKLARHVQATVTERVEAAAPGTLARAQGFTLQGSTSEERARSAAEIASSLGLQAELQKASMGLEEARAALAAAAQPALKAAVSVAKDHHNKKMTPVGGEVEGAADATGADADSTVATTDGGDDDDDAAVAQKLAAEAAESVKAQLSEGKAAVEAQLTELSSQVRQQVTGLRSLAADDPKLAKIVAELEGQSEGLKGLQAQVQESKALVEALKGREALGLRLKQLMAGEDVDQLAAAGKRLYGKLSDRDSVARQKGDQLVRRLTAKLQTQLLGVNASLDNGAGGGLYGLLNVDRLLESVEGDLTKFLMQQHAKLTAESAKKDGDKATNATDGAASAESGGGALGRVSQVLGDDSAWDPRIAFMVGFLKDCARVSVQEQLELGLEGLQERLAKPGAIKVPPLAVIRLETALLDLLDSTGGAVAVSDLAAFWGFLSQGSSMEDAAKHALALLPDDPAASAYDALGQAKDQLLLLDDGNSHEVGDASGSAAKDSKEARAAAPMSERAAARAGMAGAVMKLGGSVPPSVKALVRQARRASGETEELPRSMQELQARGVAALNSETIVRSVQSLLQSGDGYVSTMEAWRKNEQVAAALSTLSSAEMEASVLAGIESLNVGELMDDAEHALTDKAARQRLVDGMKDACLEFLLQYLPSMPIPPIDGEENGLEYSVSNLDLTRFKLKKEDVHLTLGDFSVLNRAAESARATQPVTIQEVGDGSGSSAAAVSAAAAASPSKDVPLPPPSPQQPMPPTPPPESVRGASEGVTSSSSSSSAPPNSTLLTVQADNISAEFLNLHWSYKQKYFPYLEGGGSCDAQVSGCRIALAFDLRRDFRRKRTDESDQSATTTTAAGGSSGDKSGSGRRSRSSGSSDGTGTGGGGGGGGGVVALPSGSKRPNSTTGSEGGGVLAALLEAAHVPGEFSGAVLDLTGGSGSSGSGSDDKGSKSSPGQGPSLLWEPVLVLGKCDVQIDDLAVHMTGGLGSGAVSAWLYNAIATLFRQQIREYIIASLLDTINENAAALLGSVNGFVRSSWPVVSAATHANLDNLPLIDHEVASNQSEELQRRTTGGRVLHFELSQPGPLGLHLDINTKRGIVRFSAPVEGGQAATRVAEVETQLALSGRKLKGAYLTKVNSTSVAALSISEVLVLLKKPERPITLSFVLPALKPKPGEATSTNSSAGKGASRRNSSTSSSSAGDSNSSKEGLRTTVVQFTSASLGLKIKSAASVPELVQVTGFARNPEDGSKLPAEASGQIGVGMLLLKVNATPLWGLSFSQVAQELKKAATAAASGLAGAPPLSLLLCNSTDFEVRFGSTPSDLLLARVSLGLPPPTTPGSPPVPTPPSPSTASPGSESSSSSTSKSSGTSYGIVVTGFDLAPGPIEASGSIKPGDTLVAASSIGVFPGPRGYRADVASLKDAEYPLHLDFEGLRDADSSSSSSKPVKRAMRVTIPSNPSGRLGVVFGCGNGDGRPTVKRFDLVPGEAARSGAVQPGRALVAVGRAPVDASLIAAANLKASTRSSSSDKEGGSASAAGSDPTTTTGVASPSRLSELAAGEPLPLDDCVKLLRESPFPQTPVLFRDMEQYFAMRDLASTPGA